MTFICLDPSGLLPGLQEAPNELKSLSPGIRESQAAKGVISEVA